jgi:hypothetical protein
MWGDPPGDGFTHLPLACSPLKVITALAMLATNLPSSRRISQL